MENQQYKVRKRRLIGFCYGPVVLKEVFND